MFDTSAGGRPFKVLSMCDEFTRESVGGRLGRSITADDVVTMLDQFRLERGAPEYICCDYADVGTTATTDQNSLPQSFLTGAAVMTPEK